MPLEVTPIPFPEHLPFNPKFIAPGLEESIPAGVPGASTSAINPGPASAAASAIIPPQPGGVAGPHHAIPALPDAGYTAPSIRPASVYGGHAAAGGRPIQGGYPGSVYGGVSVYAGGVGRRAINAGAGYPVGIGGSVYAGGPRSIAAGPAYPGGGGGSVHGSHTPPYAPQRAPLCSIYDNHQHLAPNSLPAPRRGPAPLLAEVADTYGAHHHHRHHHHHHLEDDKPSDASYYARPRLGHHRSSSTSSPSEASSPREPRHRRLGSVLHDHHSPHSSPASPSPLARAPPPKSPLSPSGMSQRHSPSIEGHGRTSPELPPPEHERKQRDQGKQENENLRQSRLRREPGPERGGSAEGDEGHQRQQHHHHEHHDHHHDHHHRSDPYRAVQEDPHRHHHHHRAPADVEYAPPSRHHPHRPHRPRSTSHLAIPQQTIPAQHRLRRASSMEYQQTPAMVPPLVRPYPASPSEVYDDGASIAGSAMTFMDGPVQGRTSQYGLPKYPHTPKMDYRRFCVQRGNADVFLD